MSEGSRLISIIDLGTNTFNILITEVEENGSWKPVFRNSMPVKLGRGGINRHAIAQDRFIRGLDTMMIYAQTLKNYGCEEVYAYATAAVREAVNGTNFVDEVLKKSGVKVTVIDGLVEAELIHRGVVQTIHDKSATSLIMDIGGGSTEFILSRNGNILWKESFPLGVSRISEVLELPDPLGKEGESQLKKLLRESLEPLMMACKDVKVDALVGASGSFNTMAAILLNRNGAVAEEGHLATIFKIDEFRTFMHQILSMRYEQRLAIKGMHPMRADTLHISAFFVNYILKELNIEHLFQSTYALKEGALQRLLQH
jgi:exopolyphosphatase/guanosine-5'-triphosphate,3'-diphosphate pyrophosphatase